MIFRVLLSEVLLNEGAGLKSSGCVLYSVQSMPLEAGGQSPGRVPGVTPLGPLCEGRPACEFVGLHYSSDPVRSAWSAVAFGPSWQTKKRGLNICAEGVKSMVKRAKNFRIRPSLLTTGLGSGERFFYDFLNIFRTASRETLTFETTFGQPPSKIVSKGTDLHFGLAFMK